MIPVCKPLLAGNEEKYVLDCIRSGWISSSGEYVGKFEHKFAEYCGCRHGVTTTSGTTALHLALTTLGIGKGDEVIVPTFTIAACAFAVLYTGATPIFADCDPATFTIDPESVRGRVTPATRAIMPVHIYGHPCDMDAVRDFAREFKLFIVEDAAEAHGAKYKEKRAGGLGDIGCFSFYANKAITTGEGGMLVLDDAFLAERARKLKDLAHSATRFWHTDIGFNYRMTNIQAALGLAQLEEIDRYLTLRRQHATRYSIQLSNVKGVATPRELSYVRNSYWMYGILLENKSMRDGLMKHLTSKDIGSRTFFIPMHQQPVLAAYAEGEFPIADNVSARGMYLPSGTGLTGDEIDTVCDAVKEFVK